MMVSGITTFLMRLNLAALVLAFCLAAAAGTARAQIVVMVNGSPITALDIEQRIKFDQLSTRKTPTRQEAINELIDDRLKIFIAKRYGVEVSDSDVDSAVENMARRSRATSQQMAQSLAHSGVSINTLKAKTRADIAWGQIVRGKFSSTLQVGEADVNNLLKSRGEQAETAGYIYTLYPITVIVPHDATATLVDTKRLAAENLRGRFQNCSDGLRLARALRDVAVREPITRSSADLDPQLRDLLDKMEVGRLTTIEPTPQGLQMFALCDRKSSSADSAEKREIRDQIFSKRFETQAKKFLEEVRRSAMIEYR